MISMPPFPESGNLFRDLPAQRDAEHFDPLAVSAAVRIERIVSYGQASPPGFWYDQSEDEWVVVLQGEAELECLDPPEIIRLQSGDWLRIEAGRKHRVLKTSSQTPTIWLAVFYASPQILSSDVV
ncbi:MAG: cupin domain-containing protein [Pirellulales bacterium]